MANAHRFYVPVGVVSLAAPPVDTPLAGDTYFDTTLKQLRSWDGIQWVGASSDADLDARYVDIAGDTMTGELLVPDQVVVPPSAPVVAAAKGYVDQVITVSDAPPDPVANVPVRDGLVWAVVGQGGAGEPGETPPAFITLTYVAGPAGFTVSGAYTVDWGDGSAVENFAEGAVAAHTYAVPATCVITQQLGTDLTSFILTPSANQPTGIVFDAAGLKHLEFTVTTAEKLATVEFLKPVVLYSCLALFKGQVALVSVTGSIGSLEPAYAEMFSTCSKLITLPVLDTAGCTDFSSMFRDCYVLTEIPHLDTSSGTNFNSMFSNCSYVTEIPHLDTSSGTSFSSIFQMCIRLTTTPALDLSSGTNFLNFFDACFSLRTVPDFDTSSGQDFSAMFARCILLTAAPALNTSSGTAFGAMFNGCPLLLTVPALDMSSGTDFDYMFNDCLLLGNNDAYGYRYNVSVAATPLDAADLNKFFTNLGTADNSAEQQTVDITGTPGAATCDRTIATAKGWTVTG